MAGQQLKEMRIIGERKTARKSFNEQTCGICLFLFNFGVLFDRSSSSFLGLPGVEIFFTHATADRLFQGLQACFEIFYNSQKRLSFAIQKN